MDFLSPVVSLFNLFNEGLKMANDIIKSSQSNSVKRKIIQIQLTLEDIIENAHEILSIAKGSSQKNHIPNDLQTLETMLFLQVRNLRRLLDFVRDDTSEKIMKMFTPKMRRNIIDLIHFKGGIIESVLYILSDYNKEYFQLKKNELIINTNPILLNWNHGKFITDSIEYTRQIEEMKTIQMVFSERYEEHEQIVRELAACSNELSDFIKSNISLADVKLQ